MDVSSGRLPSGKDVEFRLSEKDAAIKAPTGDQQWTLGPDKFAEAVRQPGAILPSLFLYRLLAVDGAKGFNDISYLGTFPLPGSDGLMDVLAAEYRGIEVWFYFDARGELAAMEVYPEEHEDPLEFHFSHYRPTWTAAICRAG